MTKDGIDVVVLAGGMATRMGPLCARIPKALLPVLQTPFAAWQMRELAGNLPGLRRAVFVVRDGTESLFQDMFGQLPVPAYALPEDQPKGTGGAIIFAQEKTSDLGMPLSDPFLVLNGDVLFDMRADDLIRTAQIFGSAIQGIAYDGAGSYGGLEIKDGCLMSFDTMRTGIINAGLYAFCHTALTGCAGMPSFEKDMAPYLVRSGRCGVTMTHGPFIDIGTPQNYARAGAFLADFQTKVNGWRAKN